MKIAVCVKAVPDAATGRRIDPSTKRLDRSGDLTLSDFDTHPVEEALNLRDAAGDGEVVVVSMGPEKAMDALRKALAHLRKEKIELEDPGHEIGPEAPGSPHMGIWFHDLDGYRWELSVQGKR